MSKYLSVDTSPPSEIASNVGYGDFSQWVQALPESPELKHLLLNGWGEPLGDIRDELHQAIISNKPQPDIATIANTVLSLLSDSPDDSAVVIGDGFGDDGGDTEQMSDDDQLHDTGGGATDNRGNYFPASGRQDILSFVDKEVLREFED
jgi:hypothetical protein